MKKVIISGIVGLSLLAVGVASAQTYGSCVAVSSDLSVGSRGSQVLALQQFLVSQDYPGSGTWMETGYFGAATRAALVDFQQAQGLPQTGVTDSATLSALERVSCGGTSYVSPAQPIQPYSYPGYPSYTGSTYPYSTTYPYTTSPSTTYPYTYPYTYGTGMPTITSLSQNTGEPGQTITIYGQGFESTNTIYFNSEAVPNVPSGGTSISFTIPYTSVYSTNESVQLYVTNQAGTSNSVSFTLNPSVCGSYGCSTCATTYPYSYGYTSDTGAYPNTSACGTCGTYSSYPYNYSNNNSYPYDCQGNTNSPTITYLSPQSGAIGTSVTVYGSGFTTSNNTVNFGNGIITGLQSPDGQSVSFTVPTTITGYGSQPVILGSYNVSVTNSNDITSNAVPFTVTSTIASNGGPVITNVSGPATLQTGVNGVWQVTVNDPNSGYTTASVTWGDTGNGFVDQAAPQTIYSGVQTITFSHAYAQSGTYTITFTVGNQNGQSNTYTSSITVTGATNYNGVPTISYLAPQANYVGSQVTIYGSDFQPTGNTINFGGGAITNVSSNGLSITFAVPSSVGPSCQNGYACPQYLQEITPGTYNVSVMDQYGTSNTVSFTVL